MTITGGPEPAPRSVAASPSVVAVGPAICKSSSPNPADLSFSDAYSLALVASPADSVDSISIRSARVSLPASK